ncbi:MAG: universal stress protein [Betaproteobacteria bacterium]
MPRVLIPFVEPEGARRAIAGLLAERSGPGLSVHLLAAVEPLVSGKVRVFVSPERAEAQVRDAAQHWIVQLRSMLAEAGVQSTSQIVVGPIRAAIRDSAARADIDRVLLPDRHPRQWTASQRGKHVPRTQLPATLIA